MNAAMRSARYGRVKKPAKTLKAPPTPKAVREAPVERDGVQVALPLGSIKNFQHFHNAPLSATKHAKAIPSPKAKARKRAQVAEDVPPVKLDEAPPPPDTNTGSPPNTPNAREKAEAVSTATNQRLQAKQARLRDFQRKLSQRVSQRVRKEKENAAKARSGWVSLQKKAEKTARRMANGVEGVNARVRAAPLESSSWQKGPKVTLDEHIINVTAQAQSARMALFAHSAAGQRAMNQATAPKQVAHPAFSVPPHAEQDKNLPNFSKRGDESSVQEPDGITPDGIDMVEVAKDTVPIVGGGWVPKLAYARHKQTDGFEPVNVHRACAGHLVANVRKAEMHAQRLAARRGMEHKKAKEARKRREVEIESQRIAHEENMVKQRAIVEVERSQTMELEKSQAESANTTRKSQVLQAKRQRDSATRYITALRQRLLFQLKERNMEVPPLCSCADSTGSLESGKPMWDSCANNCQFRNNPKDVKRIVQDLVRSVKFSLA
jgi:hypothetical protein